MRGSESQFAPLCLGEAALGIKFDQEPSPQRSQETCRVRADLDASGLDRCQKHRQSRLCTVKPCAAVQPFVPRDALRLPRVTTVPYHIEAG